MTELAERVRKIIAATMCGGMPPQGETLRTIYADHITLDSLAIDSLDRAEICTHLEMEFDLAVEIPEYDYEFWNTIGDVIRYIVKRTEVAA